MCSPTAIGIGLTVVSNIAEGQAAKKKGQEERRIAEFNALQMENEATRARNIGVEEENKVRQRAAVIRSQQRAQMGAANIDLGSGSAVDLQLETEMLGEVDALRVKSNYEAQATSRESQAFITRKQGEQAERAGNAAYQASFLGAGGKLLSNKVASNWFTPDSAAKVNEGDWNRINEGDW